MTAFQGQDRILLYSYSICTECPEVRKTISSADQYPVGEDRWRQQVESRVEKKKKKSRYENSWTLQLASLTHSG